MEHSPSHSHPSPGLKATPEEPPTSIPITQPARAGGGGEIVVMSSEPLGSLDVGGGGVEVEGKEGKDEEEVVGSDEEEMWTRDERRDVSALVEEGRKVELESPSPSPTQNVEMDKQTSAMGHGRSVPSQIVVGEDVQPVASLLSHMEAEVELGSSFQGAPVVTDAELPDTQWTTSLVVEPLAPESSHAEPEVELESSSQVAPVVMDADLPDTQWTTSLVMDPNHPKPESNAENPPPSSPPPSSSNVLRSASQQQEASLSQQGVEIGIELPIMPNASPEKTRITQGRMEIPDSECGDTANTVSPTRAAETLAYRERMRIEEEKANLERKENERLGLDASVLVPDEDSHLVERLESDVTVDGTGVAVAAKEEATAMDIDTISTSSQKEADSKCSAATHDDEVDMITTAGVDTAATTHTEVEAPSTEKSIEKADVSMEDRPVQGRKSSRKVESTTTGVDYPSLKVPELKRMLQKRSLSGTGNKATLIAKLQEDDKKTAGLEKEYIPESSDQPTKRGLSVPDSDDDEADTPSKRIKRAAKNVETVDALPATVVAKAQTVELLSSPAKATPTVSSAASSTTKPTIFTSVTTPPPLPKKPISLPTSKRPSHPSFSTDPIFAELKSIKISQLTTRNASLTSQLEAMKAKLAEVKSELTDEGGPGETVKRHIRLLHEYNDVRDVGQGLLGLIADQRGVRVGALYEEFGVGVGD